MIEFESSFLCPFLNFQLYIAIPELADKENQEKHTVKTQLKTITHQAAEHMHWQFR